MEQDGIRQVGVFLAFLNKIFRYTSDYFGLILKVQNALSLF